ncbi:hypothetical protein ACFQ07_15275, partial [Actinomadura adrarensis]
MWALVLLFGFLVGIATAPTMVVFGVMDAVRYGRRSTAELVKACGLVAFGVAVGMYTWGVLHAGSAVLTAEDGGTDSSPLIPCRGEADPATVAKVVDYGISLVPLGFECHLSDGGSYATSAVPGYVNPVAGL